MLIMITVRARHPLLSVFAIGLVVTAVISNTVNRLTVAIRRSGKWVSNELVEALIRNIWDRQATPVLKVHWVERSIL